MRPLIWPGPLPGWELRSPCSPGFPRTGSPPTRKRCERRSKKASHHRFHPGGFLYWRGGPAAKSRMPGHRARRTGRARHCLAGDRPGPEAPDPCIRPGFRRHRPDGRLRAGQLRRSLAVNDRECIAVDADQHTSNPKVYAVGDAVSGPSSVVRAMASGRRIAQLVHEDLGGVAPSPPGLRPAGRDFCAVPENLPRERRLQMPERQPDERRTNFSEVALGFNAAQMCGRGRALPPVRRLFGMPAVRRRLRRPQGHRPRQASEET